MMPPLDRLQPSSGRPAGPWRRTPPAVAPRGGAGRGSSTPGHVPRPRACDAQAGRGGPCHIRRTFRPGRRSHPLCCQACQAVAKAKTTPQTLLSEPFGLRAELQLSSPGRAVIGIAEDLNHFLLGVTNHCSIHFDDGKAALCGRRHGPVRAATMGYKSR